ncbi:MAG: hypothetical protein JWO73_319 [Candidatus Taylorbacteria bacterium]|nr:hypothetical protein [Candidatus Taylorbacteria bacterium]
MQEKPLKPFKKIGPLFISAHFKDAKDPCIVFDGRIWHIYGSGGNVRKEEWKVLHATAQSIEGPWTEQEPAILLGLDGPHVAAPSVVYDPADKLFHMAIQKDFMMIGGGIEYLVSADGKKFTLTHTLLDPISDSSEAGLYDPHFSEADGKKYMVYAGMPSKMTYARAFTPQPDAYLAESESGLWSGPWKRLKKILDHDDIAWHHNSREHVDYEWGIEGPQIVALPNGKVLLNATCFIEGERRGTRQRVFFALADRPEGPYRSLGPVIPPGASDSADQEWESGENGHASAYVKDDILHLFYQARSRKDPDPRANNWQYGLALFRLDDMR